MTDDDDAAPTRERLRHEPIERHVETIVYDRDQRPSRVLVDRALGTVERMARRGTISDEMVTAAERFRADFNTSMLQPLRALQMRERSRGSPATTPQEISWRATRARQRICDAVDAIRAVAASGQSSVRKNPSRPGR